MDAPVLFATIDRKLGLRDGTVEDWATGILEGFPHVEGDGVARVEDVRKWAFDGGLLVKLPGDAVAVLSSVGLDRTEQPAAAAVVDPSAGRVTAADAAAVGGFFDGGDGLDRTPQREAAAVVVSDPAPAGVVDPAPAGVVDPDVEADPVVVEWVTIRVPVVRDSGGMLPARINQSFSLRGGDLHIRKAFGDVLAGAREQGVQVRDKTVVNNFSAMYRMIGELISEATK